MAKEGSSANPSVPLHQVLEAEFAVLHGKLPPDYSTWRKQELALFNCRWKWSFNLLIL